MERKKLPLSQFPTPEWKRGARSCDPETACTQTKSSFRQGLMAAGLSTPQTTAYSADPTGVTNGHLELSSECESRVRIGQHQ